MENKVMRFSGRISKADFIECEDGTRQITFREAADETTIYVDELKKIYQICKDIGWINQENKEG